MKSILTALKTELSTNIPWLKDIAVVADEMMVPPGVRLPFIGLKDGPIERGEGFSETLTERLTVYVILYQQILKDEATVMGDGDKPGILELATDVHEVLNENFLALAGIDRAFCSDEEESHVVERADGGNVMQRKKLTYIYERTT